MKNKGSCLYVTVMMTRYTDFKIFIYLVHFSFSVINNCNILYVYVYVYVYVLYVYVLWFFIRSENFAKCKSIIFFNTMQMIVFAEVQHLFVKCRNLGCSSEYECFLRRPEGNCSIPLCKHTPDCIMPRGRVHRILYIMWRKFINIFCFPS